MIQDLTSKKLIGATEVMNGVYYLKPSARGAVFATICTKEAILWHQRLGHPSFGSLSSLLDSCDFHLNKEQLSCCDVCHRAKQARNPFTISTNKAERPFSLIHCDLWDRYHTPSLGGCHYFLCIVNDFSRTIWVFLLNDKTKTDNRLVDFCSMMKTQFGGHVQTLRSDNGKEFTNKPLQTYFRENEILHETSCVNTPQQNGRIERKNHHILNVARALRFQTSLTLKIGVNVCLQQHILLMGLLQKF